MTTEACFWSGHLVRKHTLLFYMKLMTVRFDLDKKQSEISCCYCSSAFNLKTPSFFACAPHLYLWILIGWQLLWSDQQEDPHTLLHSSCRAHRYTFTITASIQSHIDVFITSRGLASNLRFSSSGEGSSVLHQEKKDEDHLCA